MKIIIESIVQFSLILGTVWLVGYLVHKYSIKTCPKCGKHRVNYKYTSVDNHLNKDYDIYTCNNCHCEFAINIYTKELKIRK